MGLSTAVAATVEPVNVAMAKAHLRLPQDEEDGLLAGYLLTAREFCENETRKRFVTQTLDWTLRDWPVRCVEGYRITRLDLPIAPIQSVSSITYVDTNGNSATLSSSNYIARLDEANPFIEPAYGVVWPAVRCQPGAITVRFVAGWDVASVPEMLRTAICLHVEILLDRDPSQKDLLEQARDTLLDHYRSRRIL